MDRKQSLINSAIRLFASSGFDGTTTLSIGNHAGVTEPLIHYHFKNKDGLYAHVINLVFTEYFSKIDAFPKDTETEFDKLANLIKFHLKFADEFPDETLIMTSASPSKLHDSAHIWAGFITKQRTKMSRYLTACLKKGIESGEFRSMAVKGTSDLLLAMINGLMRRKNLKLNKSGGLEKSTIEFCREALCIKKA
jgi:AcrR family transcriptional regulator